MFRAYYKGMLSFFSTGGTFIDSLLVGSLLFILSDSSSLPGISWSDPVTFVPFLLFFESLESSSCRRWSYGHRNQYFQHGCSCDILGFDLLACDGFVLVELSARLWLLEDVVYIVVHVLRGVDLSVELELDLKLVVGHREVRVDLGSHCGLRSAAGSSRTGSRAPSSPSRRALGRASSRRRSLACLRISANASS